MSSMMVDDFAAAWRSDGSGLWTAAVSAAAAHLGADGKGMIITANPGAGWPFLQRVFSPGLDLRTAAELRFWLRSSRTASGADDKPFFLAFEAGTDPASMSLPWQRYIRIDQRNAWELHRLWLGD